MSYDVLEQQIESLSLEQRQSVFDFIQFLVLKNQNSNEKEIISSRPNYSEEWVNLFGSVLDTSFTRPPQPKFECREVL